MKKKKAPKKAISGQSRTLTLWIGEDQLRRLDRAKQLLQARSRSTACVTRGEAVRTAIDWLLIELLDEHSHPEDPADRVTSEILDLIHALADQYRFPAVRQSAEQKPEVNI